MTDYTSFIIDFYITVNNNTPSATVVASASAPSTSSVSVSINDLLTFLQTNDISLSNYMLITRIVGEIVSKLSSSTSNLIKTALTSLSSSVSDKSSLISSLNALNLALSTESTSNVSTSTTTPENDTMTTAPAPSTNLNMRSKRNTTTTKVTKFKGLGQKLVGLQTNATTSSNFISNLLTKLKSSVQLLATNSTKTTGTTSTIATSQGTKIANILNTNGTTSQGTPNNIFNNIVISLLPIKPKGTRTGSVAPPTQPQPSAITDLTSLQVPQPSSDLTITTTTTEATDYYEITTSPLNGLLNVVFSYYPANSTTSSFACNFYLTPASLSYLSTNAYISAIKMSSSQKEKLADNVGLSTSTSPSNQDVWNSYLIWLFSFLSFGVASQLGFTKVLPYPGTTSGSINYMMSNKYMELVGNFGLTVQASSMDSDDAALVSTAIPHEWPSMMYSFDSKSNSHGAYGYAAQSLNSTVSKQTSTSVTS